MFYLSMIGIYLTVSIISCMRRDGKEKTINLSFDSMLPISLGADIEPVFNVKTLL